MQALLSYDQSPPLAAPFRFFLTAPLFGMLAGLLLLWSGEELFASRWMPSALAITHLMTVGFMALVMLGALVQILPVVAGANMARPTLVSNVVHAGVTLGTLALGFAFLGGGPDWFAGAALLLGLAVTVFVGAAAHALFRVPSTGPTIHGLKLALVGLTVTVGLGVVLALSFRWPLELPILQLTDIHLGWGFVGWGCVLLAAVAYVVVPMFQITPSYPSWFARSFSLAALGLAALWSVGDLFFPGPVALAAAVLLVVLSALFAVITLNLQRRSKRPQFDATQHLWRGAMLSGLAACALWGLSRVSSVVDAWPAWPFLFAVLLIFGAFASVIVGMLYKIVPFLVWLHLQNQGQGLVMAPNMKKIIDERAMNRQTLAHLGACVLLALAAVWPQWFALPAGATMVAAHAFLLWNLLGALAVYRRHQQTITAKRAASLSSQP